MAPDQCPYGAATANSAINDGRGFASTEATCAFNGVRLMVNQVAIEYDEPEKIFEPFVSTAWKLEQRRYDRINARRKYLSDVARAKRHFGFTKPVKKHSSRKHKR